VKTDDWYLSFFVRRACYCADGLKDSLSPS
jgi:hypothetical protein